MEPAEEVLIAYGVVSLAYGFLLGLPLTSVRLRARHAPHHLLTAHLAAIIQGGLHLALAYAVRFSMLAPELETAAAGLLAAGCAFFVLGATVNWVRRVGDHFAERSLGWKLLAASAPANLAAIGIFLVGVLCAL